MIGVFSDDPVHQEAILTHAAGTNVHRFQKNVKPSVSRVYWTDDLELPTVELYRLLESAESTLVVFNPKPSPLIFDAGILAAPPEMVATELEPYPEPVRPELAQALKGLSVKAIREVLSLTAVRTGAVTPMEVRRTRSSVSVGVQGLYPVDTSYDFYDCPAAVSQWMNLNLPYFRKDGHPKLQPRGLLFVGQPGVGKSMAPKAIARELGIPLYRLDLASAMDRWLGTAEQRVAHSLQIVEKESPAILLIDEAEKVFGKHADEDAVQRILSQLLWWMAEHRSKVLTILTTNDLPALPPELYRPGRIDQVINLTGLSLSESKQFATQVYKAVTGKVCTIDRQHKINQELGNLGDWVKTKIPPPVGSASPLFQQMLTPHAVVWKTVTDVIKTHGWDTC